MGPSKQVTRAALTEQTNATLGKLTPDSYEKQLTTEMLKRSVTSHTTDITSVEVSVTKYPQLYCEGFKNLILWLL